MKLATITLIVLALIPTGTLAQARPTDVPRQIYGKVQVIDGTTFKFVKTRQLIRLAGYEAPRLAQNATTESVTWPVGQVSRAWMILQTLGQDVNCAPIGRDTNKNLRQIWQRRQSRKGSATPSTIVMNPKSLPISILRGGREGLVSASGRRRTCLLPGSTKHRQSLVSSPMVARQPPKRGFLCPCPSLPTKHCRSRRCTEVK